MSTLGIESSLTRHCCAVHTMPPGQSKVLLHGITALVLELSNETPIEQATPQDAVLATSRESTTGPQLRPLTGLSVLHRAGIEFVGVLGIVVNVQPPSDRVSVVRIRWVMVGVAGVLVLGVSHHDCEWKTSCNTKRRIVVN
jgi:hypothetical protein